MIETATYTGVLKLADSDSYSAGLFQSHGLEPPRTATVRVEYARDGASECVRYFVGGRPFGSLYLDREAIAEVVPGFNKVVFRPLTERGGYTMLGFVLPPSETSFFFRDRDPGGLYDGDGCKTGSAGCTEFVAPLHFGGANQIVRLSPEGDKIEGSIMNGKPLVEWTFVPGPRGLPKEVYFSEWRLGPQVASAHYTLAGVTKVPGTLSRRDFIPKVAIMETSKDSDVYGGAYDPNVRDIWAHRAKQEQTHARIKQEQTHALIKQKQNHARTEQESRPPFGLIAAALLIVAFGVWFGFRRVGRKGND